MHLQWFMPMHYVSGHGHTHKINVTTFTPFDQIFMGACLNCVALLCMVHSSLILEHYSQLCSVVHRKASFLVCITAKLGIMNARRRTVTLAIL